VTAANHDSMELPVKLDPKVKAVLERVSSDRGTSMNDVAVGALAARYGFPFEGTGRRSPGARGGETVMLRLPPELYALVHVLQVADLDADAIATLLRIFAECGCVRKPRKKNLFVSDLLLEMLAAPVAA